MAQEWFERFEGAGLDGVVAKPLDLPYRPGARIMVKVKHERTADCVVAGLRLHKSGPVVGSLLLGLYDDAGRLQHVGVCASFPMARRKALMEELEPLRMESVEGHPWQEWGSEEAQAADRLPGGPSPVDRQEGPVVAAAAPRAGGRGRLRPHAGRPLPAHRAVPPLAPGPRAGQLHVRAAGGAGAVRPGGGAGRMTGRTTG